MAVQTEGALATAPAGSPAGPPTSHPSRLLSFGVYFLVFLVYWKVIGLPTDPIQLFLWLWAAEIAWNIGDPWRRHIGFLRDWWLIVAVLVLYDYSRGIADNLGVPLHIDEPIHFDEALTGGTLPTLWLQQHLCGSPCTQRTPAQWYDVVLGFVYFSHFVTAMIVAAVLWVRSRPLFVSFMRRFIALDVLGLAIYIAYPMAPPWWASVHGHIAASIPRTTDRGWELLGLHSAGKLMTDGAALSNPVAAMPSLHTAFATLVAVFAIAHLRSRWRGAMLLYPATMGFTLVYFGEHYILDVLAGIVCALAVVAVVGAAERWLAGLRGPTPEEPMPEEDRRNSASVPG